MTRTPHSAESGRSIGAKAYEFRQAISVITRSEYVSECERWQPASLGRYLKSSG